jgi:peroxiredoxin
MITGAFALAAIGAGAVSMSHSTKVYAATPAGGIAIGKPAPGFTLANVATGQSESLDTLRKSKKATVVMFIATRCPVSNAYNDRMETLVKRYAAKGVAFVGINANRTEPTTEVASHAHSHNFTFPVLKDADDTVADLYNAHVTPETFVINADGAVVYHGRIDNNMDPSDVESNDLANAIDEVLAGKSVTKPETKAFGCSIKRAE